MMSAEVAVESKTAPSPLGRGGRWKSRAVEEGRLGGPRVIGEGKSGRRSRAEGSTRTTTHAHGHAHVRRNRRMGLPHSRCRGPEIVSHRSMVRAWESSVKVGPMWVDGPPAPAIRNTLLGIGGSPFPLAGIIELADSRPKSSLSPPTLIPGGALCPDPCRPCVPDSARPPAVFSGGAFSPPWAGLPAAAISQTPAGCRDSSSSLSSWSRPSRRHFPARRRSSPARRRPHLNRPHSNELSPLPARHGCPETTQPCDPSGSRTTTGSAVWSRRKSPPTGAG